MILTLKGKLKKGKVLAMRPNLSVRVLNWDEVHFLAGKRGFFNVEPMYTKKELIGVIVLKYLLIEQNLKDIMLFKAVCL